MTTVISCMDVAWQELGLAPALLSNNSGHRIMVRVGAAVPDAETPGHILGEGDTLRLEETGTVYGRIIREGQGPATIVVTPINANSSSTRIVSASFSRPADTVAYAVGDIVANSTSAGSVTLLEFTAARVAGGAGAIRRARMRKTGTGVSGALFRLHLYHSAPVPASGDNGAWLTNRAADYIGAIDIPVDRVFSDGAAGNGIPISGGELNFDLSGVGGVTVFGLIEARGAYTPTSAETFSITLEVYQE